MRAFDLGPTQGATVLQYLTLQPYQASGSSQFQFDPAVDKQARNFEVSYTPQGKYLDLKVSRPTLQIEGPWQVTLPVK